MIETDGNRSKSALSVLKTHSLILFLAVLAVHDTKVLIGSQLMQGHSWNFCS